VIERLFENDNSPEYWKRNGDKARLLAFYGPDGYEKVPDKWEDFDLVCERADYAGLKGYDPRFRLDHGYDETKPDDMLDIEDMRQAAAFRGGECLSEKMTMGDLYTKLRWRCAEGHEFETSPYAVLKAGHWCSECLGAKNEWREDLIAARSPFHAQVWRDTHAPDECFVYREINGKAEAEKCR
jgi:hypothetical protein